MYIISKRTLKDYYDGIVGSVGIDKTIVFERHIQEFRLKEKGFPEIFNQKNGFDSISQFGINENKTKYDGFSPFIVGFCGKIYIGYKLFKDIKEIYSGYSEFETEITYDLDYIESILEDKPTRYFTKVYGEFKDVVNEILNFDLIELHREFNTPYFVYDRNSNPSRDRWGFRGYEEFIVNPILKEYQFYKVFDAYQTFQEIQMYVSGVLGTNEKEIIEVEDKYKIEQHGFDKFSFRKDPQVKKRRKYRKS